MNKARQVYTAVVRPTMTYGAAVRHSTKRTREKSLGSAAKLTTLQDKCLRSITGNDRAAKINVLEPQSGVIPLDIHLDRAVLRARDVGRCDEAIRLAREKMRRRLRGKEGGGKVS